MAQMNKGFKMLVGLYAAGLLVNLVALIFTYQNDSYYFMFINIVAGLLCAFRLRDLFRQTRA